MQAQIDQQGKRIQDFTEGMKRLSASAAAAAAKDDMMQQLRHEIREKDAYIHKLQAKFSQAISGGAASKAGWTTPRTLAAGSSSKDKSVSQNDVSPLDSSLGRGKVALEQLEFLSKVFEQEIGIIDTSALHRPRPSPIIAPEKLQAMLAVDNQAPPPNSSSHSDAAPSSRPLFLARRLRLSTPPQEKGAAASQPLELPPALAPVLSSKSIAPQVPPLHVQQAVRRKMFQAPLSARGRIETRHQLPMGFGSNAGSLVGAGDAAQSFRIDAPGFASLEPSVRALSSPVHFFKRIIEATRACCSC
jgi:hypothetical protein